MARDKYRLFAREGVIASPEQRDLVAALVESSSLLDAYPSAVEIDVRIGGPIKEGSSLANAHETWNPGAFDRIDAIPGFPFREAEEICPGGLTRITIDFVDRRVPGMGSFYGFTGYFISLLANLGDSSVWDARGESAS